MPSKHAPQFEPPVDLDQGKYGVGITWDSIGGEEVDIDLQCVIVDKRGAIVDAVYYNNLLALGGGIGHSGDQKTGNKSGFDEIIWMKLKALPADVQMIIFVVAAYADGRLDDAKGKKVVLLHQNAFTPVQQVRIPNTGCDVNVPCLVQRNERAPGGWQFQAMTDNYWHGSHFLDILEPTLGDIIRRQIVGAPQQQTVSFEMDKGCVTDFAGKLKRIALGIGAELMSVQKHRATYKECQALKVDIDISAACYTSQGKRLGIVNGHTNAEGMFGITHSGDNLGGVNASQMLQMDDEAIQVNLAGVPAKVHQIVLLLSIANGTFENVRSCYARVCDQECKQLVRYAVSGGRKESGLIVGRLVREPGNRWGFQAVGKFYDHSQMHQVIRKLFYTTAPDTAQAPRKDRKLTTAKMAAPVAKASQSPPSGHSPVGQSSTHVVDAFVGNQEDGTDGSNRVASKETEDGRGSEGSKEAVDGAGVQSQEIREVGELSDLTNRTHSQAKVERLVLLQAAVDDAPSEDLSASHTTHGQQEELTTPEELLRTMRRTTTTATLNSIKLAQALGQVNSWNESEQGMEPTVTRSRIRKGTLSWNESEQGMEPTVTRSRIRKGTLSLIEVEDQAAADPPLGSGIELVEREPCLRLPVLLGEQRVVAQEKEDERDHQKEYTQATSAYCSISNMIYAGWGGHLQLWPTL